MKRAVLAALICTAGAAAAQDVMIPLAPGPNDTVSTQIYHCGEDAPFAVQYLNIGENHLALVPVAGTQRVFVNVIAGSGARYVAGSLEWWTKGDTAVMTDAMSTAPPRDCVAGDLPR